MWYKNSLWLLPNPLNEAPEAVLARALYESKMDNDVLVGLIYFAIFAREALAGNGAHTRRAFKHHGCTPNRVVDKLRLPMTQAELEIVSCLIQLIKQGRTASELLELNQTGVKHLGPVVVPQSRPEITPIFGDDYGDDLSLD